MKNIRIYAHGTGSGSPGSGGYAAVLLQPDGVFEIAGHVEETDSNRTKIIAVIEALRAAPDAGEVALYTDSKYIVNAVSAGWIEKWVARGWKKRDGVKVLNVDLWLALLDAVDRHPGLKFVWLRGRARNMYSDTLRLLRVKP